jgi:UDP-N-acetyl-2-amino-2-deoxyglucuronate dehydrogenase
VVAPVLAAATEQREVVVGAAKDASEQRLPERDNRTMRPLGFAVVGAGAIGRVFADAVAGAADAELRLVVARRPDPARELAEAHGAAWSTDLEGYLATAEDVDVVIVATPSGTHADVAVPALEAGKHVLVEKPLDVTLAAADRIVEAERRTGNVVAVVSQHRFDRPAERVAAAVRDGHLGRLTSATASCAWWRGQSYYDSGAWRGTWALDGGGATMNQAVHIIDLMLAMLGPPEEVFAYTGTLAHERIEVEDTAVAVVRFASGALGTVHATTAAYPGVEAALRVHGDAGSAVIVDDDLLFLHATDGVAPEVRMAESGAATNQVTATDRLGDDERGLGPAHERQLEDLVAVVRARQRGDRSARPRVGTTEGRRALALVLGIYESARTGRPVRLDAPAR